jgi:hypothetical protein
MALPVLPSGWTGYTPQQKISWFNSNGTTIEELVGAGVPDSDILYMLNNGYNPPAPVVQEPIQQEPIYTQPEPVYQEPVYQEPVYQEPVYTQPVYQEPVYTPPVYTPPPAPTYNIFGLQWDSAAPLSTKQGYVSSLLTAGITPDQIKAKIAELDPANANQAAYDLLGIPSAPPPPTTTTTTNTTNTTGLLGGDTSVPTTTVTPPTTTVVEQPRNTSQDAVTLMAAQLGLGLPNEWQYYTPQDKVNWFNANNVTEQTLKDYKVPQSDIDYAKTLGLGTTTAPPPSYQLPTGMTLPSGWSAFTGQQKVDWYNQNRVTADMLRAMGVPETDVQGAITLGLGQTTTQPPAGTTQPPRTFNPADYMPPTFNLPATNFVPFTTGGGQTSLAAPTTGFFYKTTPTEQVPFQFQSGAAGYTNLRPMTLEFGIPQAVSQVQQFQPGYFNQAGILQNYDWAKTNTQLAEQAAQEAQQQAAQDSGIAQGGMYMGGKVESDNLSYEKGGKIRSLLGPNPDGPDEGYAKLQRGEYVVRRKAVNKYGEDFLEALNEARMPKEKLKSLL